MRDDLDPNLMNTAAEEAADSGQRYPIVSCIGVGPKSDTFFVQDAMAGRKDAVRRLFHEDFTNENPDLIDMSLAPLSALYHPNLALVTDYGLEEGRAFIVREKAEGVKLTEALVGAPKAQAMSLIGQLLLALDYLYAHNVLHLGLKPENIFVDKSGSHWRLKLTDYGFYQVMYPPSKMESNVVGAPPYTAPEYAIRRALDVKSDLYSVGVYLYLALAGRPPFAGKDTVALLQEQLKKDPAPIGNVGPKLNSFVMRLLSRDPQSRFPNPRQAWNAFYEAADDPQLAKGVILPQLFTDSEEVFRYQEYLKLFRRIALQGGRWVITGERGSGKSFLARWLERLFWLNQKPVLRFPGERIALLEGEHSLNPSEPTYVLVDDADSGPVEAWLRARPYAHIVAFVQDKNWTQKKSGWQNYPLKPLDPKQLAGVLERNLGLAGDRINQEWMRVTNGEASRVVEHGRTLAEQQIVHPAGLQWKMEAEKYLGSRAQHAGDPFVVLPEGPRRVLALLALIQLPVKADHLAAWAELPPEGIAPALAPLLRAEFIRRIAAAGQEFFQAVVVPPKSFQDYLAEGDVMRVIQDLARMERPRGAIEAMSRYFSAERLKEPALALLRARLACDAGLHAAVLKTIDSNFVQALKPAQKSEAFETLGRSLLATGKGKQAEASLKNAYKAYQAENRVDGRVRTLMWLGDWCRQEGDQEKAIRFFQQALTDAEQSEDRDALEGRIELHIGDLYAAATDFENAEARYTISLQKLGYGGQEGSIADVYAHWAQTSLQMGEEQKAEWLALEGLRRAIFLGRGTTEGQLFRVLAKLQELKGNLRGAAERLAEAIYTLSHTGDALAHLKALMERAHFYERNRELILASQDAQEAVELAKKLGNGDLEGQAHLVLGKVSRRDINHFEKAIKHLDYAYQKLSEARNARLAWECLFEKGEIERYRENNAEAKVFFQQALQLLEHALGATVPGTPESNELNQKRAQLEMIMGSLR